jgi:hypothetical protein
MAQTLYYTVSFVTLHQKAPAGVDPGLNSGNPYLEINGFQTSRTKYGLEFGFGDPVKIEVSMGSTTQNGRLALPPWSSHPI